jgi:hypothetical protein
MDMQATRMNGIGQVCLFIMKTKAGNGFESIGSRILPPLILGMDGIEVLVVATSVALPWKSTAKITTEVVTTEKEKPPQP